jgi:hypothetical protein
VRANVAGVIARLRPVEHGQATHVEASAEVHRDPGSIPGASTFGKALGKKIAGRKMAGPTSIFLPANFLPQLA